MIAVGNGTTNIAEKVLVLAVKKHQLIGTTITVQKPQRMNIIHW